MARAVAQEVQRDMRLGASERYVYVSSPAEFDAVYAQHIGFIWRVLRSMGVSDVLVEDAVQDVFIVVHRRLREFDGRHSIRTWLYAIAYRVACDHRRRSRRTQAQEPLEPELRDRSPMPDESAERAEALREISELLDGLDDEKRAVLVLTEIEGMTAQEVADATGAGINTVYTRLRRARLQLNQMVAVRQKRSP